MVTSVMYDAYFNWHVMLKVRETWQKKSGTLARSMIWESNMSSPLSLTLCMKEIHLSDIAYLIWVLVSIYKSNSK